MNDPGEFEAQHAHHACVNGHEWHGRAWPTCPICQGERATDDPPMHYCYRNCGRVGIALDDVGNVVCADARDHGRCSADGVKIPVALPRKIDGVEVATIIAGLSSDRWRDEVNRLTDENRMLRSACERYQMAFDSQRAEMEKQRDAHWRDGHVMNPYLVTQLRNAHDNGALCREAADEIEPPQDGRYPLSELEMTLSSLTIWTPTVSMQVRDDEVALHVMDGAPRSSEDGHPVMIPKHEARHIRDLLNMATARGFL